MLLRESRLIEAAEATIIHVPKSELYAKKLVHVLELPWLKINDVTCDHCIDPGHRLSRDSTCYISFPLEATNRLVDQPTA